MTTQDYMQTVEPEPHHHDLFSTPAPNAEYMEDWLARCCELVDNYCPKVFYFDWWIYESGPC